MGDTNIYTIDGKIYDEINRKTTHQLAGLLSKKLQELGIEYGSCIEFGCGTGLLLAEMASSCQQIAGCDIADKMLTCASTRLPRHALLKNEDMRWFNPGNQYELAMCVNDSINYLQGMTEWRAFLNNAWECMFVGGTLIFEYDTIYDLTEVWDENVNIHEGTDFYCIKTFGYNKQTGCGEELHVYFIRNGDVWLRQEEKHLLFSFKHPEVLNACTEAGFKLRATQDGDTGREFITNASLRCVLYLEKVGRPPAHLNIRQVL